MGLDLSQEAIACARERADEGELHNLRFEVRDLTVFRREVAEAAYDLVTAFDAIHDQARPDHVLVGVRRSLKPGGVFLMQDIRAYSTIAENRDHPVGTALHGLVYALYDVVGERRYGPWHDVGRAEGPRILESGRFYARRGPHS